LHRKRDHLCRNDDFIRIAATRCNLFVLVFPQSNPNAAENIKIASTGPGLSTLPLEIAARKSFFRDEGIDALVITMRANIAVNALLTRNVDYATPSTSTIKAATAGLPVKTIAVLLGRPDYFLTVKKEIRSVRDLKGKRIAIGSFGPPPISLSAWSPNKTDWTRIAISFVCKWGAPRHAMLLCLRAQWMRRS
jgi:ABC-type nitrate/sulfonate/bicarbonate transport system substrate-binding protein